MVKKILKEEFVNGKTKFDWLFLGLGLIMQIIAIVYGYITNTPDNLVSIISSISGVLSVVLCAQGKISFYVFGFIQLFTYVFGVAIPNKLYRAFQRTGCDNEYLQGKAHAYSIVVDMIDDIIKESDSHA